MEIKSFTKTIYNSTFLTSLFTNVITATLLFIVCFNIINNIYNNQYNKSSDYINNYINEILNNNNIIEKLNNIDSKYFENTADNANLEIELNYLINSKISICEGNSLYIFNNKQSLEDKLPINLFNVYKNYKDKTKVTNEIISINNQIYILNINKLKNIGYIHFFNITNCISLEKLFIKDSLLGYRFNEKNYLFSSVSYFNKKNIHAIPLNINNISLIYSTEQQVNDTLILLCVIIIFASIRIFVSLINAKRNVNKISKPLDDLVNNTEKLAAHEVSEKLNRFDYPYAEFKQLAEAFNKVLLSRELSEIKLFRSFEQMENVVHKRTQELIATNEQLTTAIKKAEEANALKSQFLANISHEIRTPLNCIMGFCDIILTEDHSDAVTVQVKQILHESETLLHLINDFLDYSKIDAGKMTLAESELDIRSLVNSLMKSGQVQAGDRNIILYSEIDESVPQIILSDELRLYQVISNIFYNAIKFTPNGSVKIKIHTILENDELKLSISVIDTGIGIPENSIKSIFNKFEQVDGSLTRKYRGSGLGLTICKKIIELMNGEIFVESELNKGSTFRFIIPIKAHILSIDDNSDLKIQDDQTTHSEGSKILLVEDYPVNQIVAKKHLEMNNHIVIIAENGQEAIDICKDTLFDLILMDLQMPIMDGFKATKHIRGTMGLNYQTPILAMTANAMDAAKQTCLDSGMNGIITKPIRKKMFLKEVDFWLNQKTK